MAITINGNGTVTGISVGGLPDGIVDTDMLAALAVSDAKIANTTITDAKIANTTISEGKLAASVNTITEADQWRVNTQFTTDDASPIGANWERADTIFDKIGTGMTESSGVFTFPSTGIWRVDFQTYCYRVNSDVRFTSADIQATDDGGSNWTVRSSLYNNVGTSSALGVFSAMSPSVILDITSTSDKKVRFRVQSSSDCVWEANSTSQVMGATFIRLGDT